MSKGPIAFLSYVHFDDEHDTGRITEICSRLSGEVQIQSGEEFPIFQDRADLKWSDAWKRRIGESLEVVTFLIPVITPSFFKSVECRSELERFISLENRLDRKDLILPIYYVDCPASVGRQK